MGATTNPRRGRMRIKKGDTVQVISGSQENRGKQGKVIAVYPDTRRVLVEGVNRIKRHTKVGSTGRGTKTGGIITQEAPMHISNLMLLDPGSKKPPRPTKSRLPLFPRVR